MKHRQILTGMLLIAFGCSSAEATSTKASTKKVPAKSHAKVAHKSPAKKHQAPALSKLALLQDRLPTAVSSAQQTASEHEAVLEKVPEIKGNVSVNVTPSTPATGVAAYTPGMTEAEQAKPKDRPEHPLNQIITGENDNDFYIFAENQKIPEKLIANPDAQYAVVGGNEEKVARKVNAYQWAAKRVASKVAKIKQLAALKAAKENQQLQAWRDKNLRIVYDETNPISVDARMLSAGDRVRFYLNKVAKRQHAPLPGSHLNLPDVATMPDVDSQSQSLTILQPVGEILVAELAGHSYDSKAVDKTINQMMDAELLAVNKPAAVTFAQNTPHPKAVVKPKQHVKVQHSAPAAAPKQILAMKAAAHPAPVATKPTPVTKKVVAKVQHPTEAELKLQKAEAKLAAYEAELKAAAERMAAVEKRMQEKLKQEEAKQLAVKRELEKQRKLEEAKRLAAEQKLEQEHIAAVKLAEEKRIAEAKHLAAKRKLEQKKLEAAKRLAEKQRKLQERRAREEAKRLAAQRKLEAEKLAEQKRLAAKRKLEQERLAAKRKLEAEKLAEQKRLAAKRKLEQERLAAKRKLEAEKLAEQKRLAAKRKLEAERQFAEEMKLAAQRQEEQKRLAANSAKHHKVAAAKPQTVHSIQKQLIDSRHQGAADQAARTKPVATQSGYAKDIANLQHAMTKRQQRVAESRDAKHKAQQVADKRVDAQLMRELEEFRLAQDRDDDF